jgi:divalent metal cation (Fe/Co/Zn/Cd) transporter
MTHHHHHDAHGHGEQHDDEGTGHGHSHGIVDPSITTTAEGLWALKWSFVVLMITALMQVAVVIVSGSVALLADTIHNFGDAATAIPLGIAFLLARKPPNKRFTFGYGRVEDFAGVIIVFIILFSAIVAGYESIDRLFHPQDISHLWAVAIASGIGFLGNEAVAIFRIRVVRRIGSAALIADGHHADPNVIDEIRHAAAHVSEIKEVTDVRARWLGHRLHAEVNVTLPSQITLAAAHAIAEEVRHQLLHHLKYLSLVVIHVDPEGKSGERHHRIEQHSHDGLPVHSHPA